MAKKTLQEQGVPIPSRLRGPGNAVETSSRPHSSRISSQSRGNTRRRNSTRNRSVSDYNPVNVAEKSSGGVGTLEAEFLVGLALLIMLMFSSKASFSDKIMSTMKRGALLCVTFFILALVAGAGPNASKISKAMGALIVVAIVVTSPVDTVIKDVDSLIKNDWVGTSETGKSGAPSASSGTQQSTNTNTNTSNLGQDFINAIENQLKLQGQKGPTGSNPLSGSNIKNDVGNAVAGTLNGIIPGSGDIVRKLFGL